jgi:hypothetical protein
MRNVLYLIIALATLFKTGFGQQVMKAKGELFEKPVVQAYVNPVKAELQFKEILEVMGGDFNMPQRYTQYGSQETFDPGIKNVLLGTFWYLIQSKRDDVIIGMTLLELNFSESRISDLFPNYKKNKTYLSGVKSQADTLKEKPLHFSKAYIAKTSNADDAGIFTMSPTNSFHDKKKCKVVFLHKDDRGDIMLYYFYENEKKLKRSLKKTEKMIRFRENFIPPSTK